MEIQLTTLECLRCGHSWIPRRVERPVRCAKCGSPYWDREKVKVLAKEVGKVIETPETEEGQLVEAKAKEEVW